MTAKNIQFTKIEIMILRYIFKHFKDRFNARQLAKILNLNHAHANKLCKALVEKSLLKKEDIGNSIYYTFDYKNDLAIKFVEYLLSREEKEFPEWLSVLAYSLKKFNEHIELGCVFGSSIKQSKFNDIDVLLIYDKKKEQDIKKIKDSIRKSRLVEKPIRYVELAESDLEKNKDNDVFYNILSDSIVFYNPGKYIEVVKHVSGR
jgi:hypothetical protein